MTNDQQTQIQSPSRRKMLQGSIKGALGTALLPALGSSLLAACGGNGTDSAAASAMSHAGTKPTPGLTSVDNFRDLAGADDSVAYLTITGQKLRRGVFYRSNVLTPSAADLATLNTMGIKTVYDLRTTSESQQTPDTLPTGATLVSVNIFGTDTAAAPSDPASFDAVAWMEQIEREFVTDAGIRSRFGELFTDMANGPNAQLFHCSSGKDRTGWTAAVLLSLVGVPPKTVMEDYLLTDVYTAESIKTQYAAMVTTYGQKYADAFLPMLGVQPSFLLAGFDQVAQSYGSMDNYITNGLGLSTSTQAQLKAKLLYGAP